MIQFLSRKEALKKNSILASYVIDMQKKFYAPDLFEPGENWLDEEERLVEMNEEECAIRNKPILVKFESTIDSLDDLPELKRFTDECILSTREHDKVHVEIMAGDLEKLNKILEWDGMLFIPEFPYSWLEFINSKDEDDRKVADWFLSKGVDKNFNGAIYASDEDLEAFMQLLVHFIVRRVDSFPVCRFAGVNSSAIGSVCKYGNIHYLFYKNGEYTNFENAIKETSLVEIPFGACEYKF
ncbi:hypothetical protein [Christiangramia echinicola]|uniref:hypothetical protein n=1 Tax=Christiangramia echinicola TaxID=279359 RepID=UPI00041C97D5|nr:hypothetical protein [Christiangramia echinicola]